MNQPDDKIYAFTGTDATRYGVHAAILLHSIRWWISDEEARGENIHDGRAWTSCSIRAFTELFPFLTSKQIRYALEKLVKGGALVRRGSKDNPWDRTSHYALGGNEAFANNGNTVY